MKKIVGLILVLLIGFTVTGFAKDFTAKVVVGAYSGKGTDGANEASYPLSFKVYDAASNALVSTTVVTTTGALVNVPMTPFIVTVPSNTSKTVSYYVTITDSAPVPNVSAKSPNSNAVTLSGDDTVPPESINSVTITIQ